MRIAPLLSLALLAVTLVGCRSKQRTASTGALPAASAAPAASASTAPAAVSSAAASTSSAPLAPLPAASTFEDLPTSTVSGKDFDVEIEDGSKREAWVRTRQATAKQSAELVRMPLMHRGSGWGCICPDYLMWTEPSYGGEDPTWVEPIFDPTAAAIPRDTAVIVEGYFTGKDIPFEPKGVDEGYEKATLREFRVLRTRGIERDSSGEPREAEKHAKVLLAAKDAHRETSPPADGKTYVLVALSVPVSDGSKAVAAAEKTRAELVAKGFAGAEVIDTRIAPGLFCCHLAVVASRHPTAAEADAAASQAKKKGFTLLARRAW